MTIQTKIPGATPTTAPNATTYTDLNALSALKRDPSSPQAIHAVAQQIDALFLQMMLKSMRDASAPNEQSASNELGMYQDMFDKQIALSMSQSTSLGVGAQLTRQLAAQAAAQAGTQQGAPAPALGTAVGGAPAAGAGTASQGRADSSSDADSGSATPTAASGAGSAALTTGAATAATGTPSQFVSQVFPAIQRAAAALGVNPFAMLAQAVLETGWGKRMARHPDGTPSHNMFGIKADDAWGGARVAADTVEFNGGIATQHRTAFRAYSSVEDSVNDFARLLGSSPRYREAVSGGRDAGAYIDAIGRSGYATDPGYAGKLTEIMNSSTFRGAVLAHSLRL